MSNQRDEEIATPTFSHQEWQPDAAPRASEEPLSAVLARAAAAMVPTLDARPADAREARQRALAGVSRQIPINAKAATLPELSGRINVRYRAEAEAWGWHSGNLLLLGPTGSGKTSAAAWIIRRLLEDALAAPAGDCHSSDARRFWGGARNQLELCELIRWQECRELSTTVREFPLGQGTPEAIQRCQHARLLVLDDIGASDDAATLERVLNERQKRRWPTIATSGLTVKELTAVFGEAMVRRLLQCNGRAGRIVSLFPPGTRP